MTDSETVENDVSNTDSPENGASNTTFNIATVIQDTKKVLLTPVTFYREMPTSGGFSDPIIFVIVMAVASGILTSILSIIGLGSAGIAGGFSLAMIIMFPIFMLIGSFIGAGILFVIWKLMGSEKDYEIAYRCMAYSTAMLPVLVILSIIPYLSPIVRAIWTALLMIIASIEVHSLKALTAKIVFGIIGAISLFFGVSSEYAARNIQDMLNNTASNIENSDFFKNLENLDNLEDMTPEEAGEKVGEFLKGLEEGSK